MSVKIDHVGIAVRSIEERLPFWTASLGLDPGPITTVATEGVRLAMLRAGAARVELLEPIDESSPIARFLTKRGEGIHHLTLAVADLAAVLARLRSQGVELLGDAPRPGADDTQVAFLHPRAAGGVLLELIEARAPTPTTHDVVPGSAVLLYLREPQEKLWGVLRRLDGAGVVAEAIDLGSFDDWAAQIEHGEESVVGPSLLFVPMARVERILLDRSSGHLPSLAERFLRRTGRAVQDVLDQLA